LGREIKSWSPSPPVRPSLASLCSSSRYASKRPSLQVRMRKRPPSVFSGGLFWSFCFSTFSFHERADDLPRQARDKRGENSTKLGCDITLLYNDDKQRAVGRSRLVALTPWVSCGSSAALGEKTHLFVSTFILKLHHVTKTGSGQTWGKLNKRGVFLQHAAKAGACEWTVEYVRGQDDLRYHHGIHPVRKTHTHVPFWLRSHTYMFVECL
jgi:hypothetical protein